MSKKLKSKLAKYNRNLNDKNLTIEWQKEEIRRYQRKVFAFNKIIREEVAEFNGLTFRQKLTLLFRGKLEL